MQPIDVERERFGDLYRAYAPRVHSYVRRHADLDHVEEIVADTFVTAWRRRDSFDNEDPLPWLFVTARRIAANAHRRTANRTDVLDRLERLAAQERSVDDAAVERAAALSALASLGAKEREALLLVAWDGLDHAHAADVAGCTVRAFTMRLHRARQRLAAHLAAQSTAHLDAGDPSARGHQPPMHLIEES